jgi:hypothetical protein
MRSIVAPIPALLLCVAALAPLAAVQAQTPAQTPVPRVRLLNLPTATSKTMFGAVTSVRQLADGSVLVNDVGKRSVVLLDPSFARATVVLDSATSGNSYGSRGGALIPYGDSTLLVDAASLSMLVLSPTGTVARVMSVPRSQDASFLVNSAYGVPGFDAKGRLVYRAVLRAQMPSFTMGSSSAQTFVMPEAPDSAPVVAIDLATRKSDTLAYVKIARQKVNVSRTESGMVAMPEINPLPLADDWAILSDGSVAIVRARDYHIDWVGPDGKITSSAKIPYDWQRLSDDDKAAVIDSAKVAYERARAAGPAGGRGGDPSTGFSIGTRVVIGGGTGDMRAALEGARSGTAGGVSIPPATFVSLNELPDYRPVFGGASPLRGDADGNLWVRTSATRQGSLAGPIYDVINAKGELIDRVQVPAGRAIVGFGKGGTVYLSSRDDSGVKLEKAAIR